MRGLALSIKSHADFSPQWLAIVKSSVPISTRETGRVLDGDHEVGCGWAKPLNSLLQHPPLEIVSASFARSPHREGKDRGSSGRNRTGQFHATRSPSRIVLRVLRAELVSGSGLPGGVADVLHLDSHCVSFTAGH